MEITTPSIETTIMQSQQRSIAASKERHEELIQKAQEMNLARSKELFEKGLAKSGIDTYA